MLAVRISWKKGLEREGRRRQRAGRAGRGGEGWGVACLLLFVGRQGLGQEFTPGCTLELPGVLFFLSPNIQAPSGPIKLEPLGAGP